MRSIARNRRGFLPRRPEQPRELQRVVWRRTPRARRRRPRRTGGRATWSPRLVAGGGPTSSSRRAGASPAPAPPRRAPRDRDLPPPRNVRARAPSHRRPRGPPACIVSVAEGVLRARRVAAFGLKQRLPMSRRVRALPRPRRRSGRFERRARIGRASIPPVRARRPPTSPTPPPGRRDRGALERRSKEIRRAHR